MKKQDEMVILQSYNSSLLANLLPTHVIKHFLKLSPSIQAVVSSAVYLVFVESFLPHVHMMLLRIYTMITTLKQGFCLPLFLTLLSTMRRRSPTIKALSVWGSSMRSLVTLISSWLTRGFSALKRLRQSEVLTWLPLEWTRTRCIHLNT